MILGSHRYIDTAKQSNKANTLHGPSAIQNPLSLLRSGDAQGTYLDT
jgi:hypothetical protein